MYYPDDSYKTIILKTLIYAILSQQTVENP